VSGALGRAIRRPRTDTGPAAERCDLCAVDLPQTHRHMLDTGTREISCVCQACSLLFLDAAGDGRFRLVPRRRLRLPDVPTGRLGVPVGLAYFVQRSDGTVDAYYPSPAGPTRWEVDPAVWSNLIESCPPLTVMKLEVEALLVNTTRDRRERWIVPIDDCFALVTVVRREWRGLSGGSTVWPEIDRFFAGLTEQRR
jgi:hypothetical protein